jgi:hypothetical protein
MVRQFPAEYGTIVTVNGHLTQAVFDSGSSVTIIPESKVQELDLQIVAAPQPLASVDHTPLQVIGAIRNCPFVKEEHRYTIPYVYVLRDVSEVILGADVAPHLGIYVHGLRVHPRPTYADEDDYGLKEGTAPSGATQLVDTLRSENLPSNTIPLYSNSVAVTKHVSSPRITWAQVASRSIASPIGKSCPPRDASANAVTTPTAKPVENIMDIHMAQAHSNHITAQAADLTIVPTTTTIIPITPQQPSLSSDSAQAVITPTAIAVMQETNQAREVLERQRHATLTPVFKLEQFPALQEVLAQNKALDSTQGCNLPEAVLPIPLDTEEPLYVAQYPIAHGMRHHISNQIQSWLASGVIERASGRALYNSPIFAIPKLVINGIIVKARIVIDPRKINVHIPAINYPIPKIEEIHQLIGGARFYSTLDLESGYHQFWVAEQDRPKTAITVDNVRYQFRRCPFGFKHFPAAFQRVMNGLLRDLPFVLVYIDDIRGPQCFEIARSTSPSVLCVLLIAPVVLPHVLSRLSQQGNRGVMSKLISSVDCHLIRLSIIF